MGGTINSFLLLSLTLSMLLHDLHSTRGSQLPMLVLNSEGFPRSRFGTPAVGRGTLSLSKREGGPKSGGVNIYERDKGWVMNLVLVVYLSVRLYGDF